MKVLIAFNPVAGKGRAGASARAIGEHIDGQPLADGRRIEVSLVETKVRPLEEWLLPKLDEVDLLVAIGGDGAVRMLAPAAMHAGIPLYHYPTGTENLFSRDHGMVADPNHLLDSIKRGEILEIDVGEVEGSLMLLCASLGFDADVVHDLARHRSGPITHFSYVRPILRSLFSWKRLRSRFSIAIDGGTFTAPRSGFLVIANSSQYALRLDPACDASVQDGLLDVVFLPADNVIQLLLWAVRCRFGTALRHPKVFSGRGRVISVRCEPGGRLQVDGDPSHPGIALNEIEARISDQTLLVLSGSSEKFSISIKRP